jgi:MoxR domain in the MoxR-vWA-beta-propeller ternary systems
VDINLLRQGVLARVNLGLLTGPGVRGAFLDEIFKASNSILNTLLSLTQERVYFNWGQMERSDLEFLIAASNEMPGFGATGGGVSGTGSDFKSLYAFIDRFAIRLEIPWASPTSNGGGKSDLEIATDLAIQHEANDMIDGEGTGESPACLNDFLLLGRASLQHEFVYGGKRTLHPIFNPDKLAAFKSRFIKIGCALQDNNTKPALGRITWTISPRKLLALYKVALAHALVTDTTLTRNAFATGPGEAQLWVFSLIWDSPSEKDMLREATQAAIRDSADAHG